MLVKRVLAQVFLVAKVALEVRLLDRTVDHHMALKLKRSLKHFIAARKLAVEDFPRVVDERVTPQVSIADEV